MAGIVFSKSSGLNDSVFGKSAEPIHMCRKRARRRRADDGGAEDLQHPPRVKIGLRR